MWYISDDKLCRIPIEGFRCVVPLSSGGTARKGAMGARLIAGTDAEAHYPGTWGGDSPMAAFWRPCTFRDRVDLARVS
jgi:hypothetical protein